LASTTASFTVADSFTDFSPLRRFSRANSVRANGFVLATVDANRNESCAMVVGAVTFDRNHSTIITPIAIIGAGIRVGRGRVM
jgi:hypothetical protein